MAAPKVWRWVGGGAFVVFVGVTAIVAGRGGPAEVNIVDTQHGGDVAYHDANDIVEQAEDALPTDLPDSIVLEIEAGISHLDSAEFRKAIGHLERATTAAPVPALWNALGAAYIGVGETVLAKGYVQRAAAGLPNDRAARHNMSRIR